MIGFVMAVLLARPTELAPMDAYPTITQACDVESQRAPARWRKAIRSWCRYRAWHGSRNGAWRSPDGSQIHDVDRRLGRRAYRRAVAAGWLDPGRCVWHRPPARSQDYAHWSTRGPIDTMAAWVPRYVPGCYPPWYASRNDVAARTLVRMSIRKCSRAGRCTREVLRSRR